MIIDPDFLRMRLHSLMQLESLDPTELARRIGRGNDYIRDFMSGRKNSIKIADLSKIEIALNLPSGAILNPREYMPAKNIPDSHLELNVSTRSSNAQTSDRLMPIYSLWEIGSEKQIIGEEIIDRVSPPWFVGESNRSYGVLFSSEMMEFVYEPEDIVIINPLLPVIKGKDYLFKTIKKQPDQYVMLRRLLSWNEKSWNVLAFRDGSESALSREEWGIVDRVVGKVSR